ncbi:MAG: hypothetical protein K9M81_04040 [Chthoniobacterales bacterium]|nr:hypothetical protein [Chthoniobacterales bacterium]
MGSQLDTVLDSHFDLGSSETYSPASKCSSALPPLALVASSLKSIRPI